MNISDMLSLMGTLGIGGSPQVQTDQSTDLKYLNLANNILYRRTAPFNDDVRIPYVAQNVENSAFFSLEKNPLLISKTYLSGSTKPLEQISFLKLFDINQNNNNGDPQYFSKKQKSIFIYPIKQDTVYTFNILFTPSADPLTTTTVEDDIPYPVEFHQGLVDGALYYKFREEGGFRSSDAQLEARNRWIEFITELNNYFIGSTSSYKDLSTYRNL